MKHFFIHLILIFVCNKEYYMNPHQTRINKSLYNILSSTKHTPLCMLLVLVCSSHMIVFLIISQLLCVLPINLYIIIKIE